MNNLELKRSLTIEELALLETELLNKRKSKEAAWGLWAGLSFFGAHRFYCQDYVYASIMFLTTVVPLIGLITMFITIDYFTNFQELLVYLFLFLIAGSVLWSWIDAFFLNNRIEKLNNEIESEILHKIKKL